MSTALGVPAPRLRIDDARVEQARILGAGTTLAAHRQSFAAPGPATLDQLIGWAERIGLHGRGGGGFPLARKLSALAPGRAPVIIVNWCEGDPTSSKDAVLAAGSPHLVLDGMVVLGRAVSATRVVIAVKAGSAIETAVRSALTARDDLAGLELVRVPPRFVASEASSLVSLVDGGDARPLGRWRQIWDAGVGGRPTMVTNAETVARLAVLVVRGPESIRAVGDPRDPGTVVLTISGAVRSPGVVEVATDVLLGEVLRSVGASSSGWALVGGLAGAWVPVPRLAGATAAGDSLAALGARRGVGAVVLLGDGCLLAETARIVGHLADESAGRCGPCMFGLPAIAADLMQLERGGAEGVAALQRLDRRLPVVDGRGGCAHPDGAVQLTRSALTALGGPARDHLDAHLAHGPCGAHAVVPTGAR